MPSADELVIYVTLGIVTATLVLLLIFAGPLGWFFAVFAVLGVLVFAAWSGLFERSTATRKTNCPDCGARNGVAQETCTHCDAPLEIE